jgi:hypothetical protein
VSSDKCSFDFSVIESYRRIAGVQMVEIDASLYRKEVIKKIEEAIQHLV